MITTSVFRIDYRDQISGLPILIFDNHLKQGNRSPLTQQEED